MPFIKRILVPSDFSEPALNALRYAQKLAALTQADLKVIHVFSVPVIDPYMPGETMELLMQEIKDSSDKKMKEMLASFPGVESESFHGFIIDDVIRYAEEWKADLIVMGTTGASGAKEVFFGSNASGVLSQSPIKVLSVPEVYKEHRNPTRICYASDFTGREELPFQVFLDVAKAWNADLDVLHVVSTEPVFTAEKPQDIYERMAASANYTRLHFAEISNTDITEAIESHVEATSTDILCMATHRRNLLERIFNRSKTKSIAHHTNIPLLSIRKA